MSQRPRRGNALAHSDWTSACVHQEDAPALWQQVMRAAESLSVKRAHRALLNVDAALLDEARSGPLGLITPVIRAAGARGGGPATKRAAEAELVPFVRLALTRGFSPNAHCPQIMAWEISSPPLVTAASYGFDKVVQLLLDAGATADSRNSDGESALHAAIAHPATVRYLIASGAAMARHVNTTSHLHETPFESALMSVPWTPTNRAALLAMVPHVALSDATFARLRRKHMAGRLVVLARQHAAGTGAPSSDGSWHPSSHWSFPAADRLAICQTHRLAVRGQTSLPPELWLNVFHHVQRGWFQP